MAVHHPSPGSATADKELVGRWCAYFLACIGYSRSVVQAHAYNDALIGEQIDDIDKNVGKILDKLNK